MKEFLILLMLSFLVTSGCDSTPRLESTVSEPTSPRGREASWSDLMKPTPEVCTMMQAGPRNGTTAKCYLVCIWFVGVNTKRVAESSHSISMMAPAPCNWKGQKLKIRTEEQEYKEQEDG